VFHTLTSVFIWFVYCVVNTHINYDKVFVVLYIPTFVTRFRSVVNIYLSNDMVGKCIVVQSLHGFNYPDVLLLRSYRS